MYKKSLIIYQSIKDLLKIQFIRIQNYIQHSTAMPRFCVLYRLHMKCNRKLDKVVDMS